MHARATAFGSAAAAVAIIALITGCSGPASFADRMAYLKKIANQGVETHRFILSGGGVTNTKRCTDAYNGLQDNLTPPSDQGEGMGASDAWMNQIQAFFVESCTTGLPEAVPATSTSSPSASSS